MIRDFLSRRNSLLLRTLLLELYCIEVIYEVMVKASHLHSLHLHIHTPALGLQLVDQTGIP